MSGASFFFCGTLDNSVPGGVGDRFVGFEEVVGERWFFPPRVVFPRLVVSEREVGHRSFFASDFLRAGQF